MDSALHTKLIVVCTDVPDGMRDIRMKHGEWKSRHCGTRHLLEVDRSVRSSLLNPPKIWEVGVRTGVSSPQTFRHVRV
jgi:hypothetical protein